MNSRRLQKLASTVRSIVADAILNRLNDPRISPMTSVTRVELTADLQIAKVYISVLGDESVGRRTLSGLQHAHGRVQGLLARQLHARHCPSLRFEFDDSLRRAAQTLQLIDESLGHSAHCEHDVTGTNEAVGDGSSTNDSQDHGLEP